jgi:hypothetical protein
VYTLGILLELLEVLKKKIIVITKLVFSTQCAKLFLFAMAQKYENMHVKTRWEIFGI